MPVPSFQPAAPQTLDLNRSARSGSPRAYSGAWRDSTTYTDRALAPAPGVDIAHAMPDARDPGQVPAGYPRVDYPPTFLTTTEDESYKFAVDTPGLILDTEPISHDVGDPDVQQIAPVQGVPEPPPQALAHMVDRGAPARMLFAPASHRASDERWLTPRWEQGEIQTGSVVSSLRGTNSLPVNNPDGFRLGWSVKRYAHRYMMHDRWPHTERLLHPVTAASAAASPTMTAAQSNRYTSPFAWRSFYGTKAQQFPLLRRQPPASYDVDQTNDGLTQPSDIVGDWVIG